MRIFGKSPNTDKMVSKLLIPGSFLKARRPASLQRSAVAAGLLSSVNWHTLTAISALFLGFAACPGRLSADQPSGTAPVTAATAATAAEQVRPDDVTPWQEGPKVASTPQERLALAIQALQARRAVSAKIRHKIDLFDKQLIGSGNYLEQRQEPVSLLKLELKIQLGPRTSSLVQVCDGRYLWTYSKLLGDGSLARLDAVRATKALREAETTGSGEVEMLPGLGGLPQLLRGLHVSFDFISAEKSTLNSKSGQVAVWRLQGRWKARQLAELLPRQKQAIEEGKAVDLTKLPKHLPDHVVLFLGDEDSFPYRIEYRRGFPIESKRPGEPRGRALVTMEWLDVILDQPVDPRRFEYNPAGLQFEDRTEEFLKQLDAGK
jgi:hypothetical protein